MMMMILIGQLSLVRTAGYRVVMVMMMVVIVIVMNTGGGDGGGGVLVTGLVVPKGVDLALLVLLG